MAKTNLPPAPANDNDCDRHPISFAQARHLADLSTYLRGGRI